MAHKFSTGFVLGTRPEIIKMSPIIREYQLQNLNFLVVHTGQHYSYNMDKVFLEELNLPLATHSLDVGSGTHATQTARILEGLERVLTNEKPDLILVQGDTNSVLAGALTAAKLNIPVGHVEAGLRSYDRTMPEEINRVVTDHISTLLFAPTEKSKENLLKEGVRSESISVTGNTVVDAIHQNAQYATTQSKILSKLNLKNNGFFLITVHRAENVDDQTRFTRILDSIQQLATNHQLPLIWPVHPRAQKALREFGLEQKLLTSPNISMIDPVGYLDFLVLESNAKLVLTDSGGVQEESCVLKTPCVTLRENTERPESIAVGANILVGTDLGKVLRGVEIMSQTNKDWRNPFGDGQSAKRIVENILQHHLNSSKT